MRLSIQVSLLFCLVLVQACATVEQFFNHSDGQQIQTATDRCWLLTPENSLHVVSTCETATHYQFIVQEQTYYYAKAEFQKGLRAQLRQFLRDTAFPVDGLDDAQIQIWLVAPVFRPDRAYLMVAMLNGGPNFITRLAIDMNKWQIDQDNVQLLGTEAYPTLKARQAGRLVLQAKDSITRQRLQKYLTSCALTAADINLDGAPIVLVKTPLFGEDAVAQQLMQHQQAKQIIQNLRHLPAGDEEGARALVYHFPLQGN